MEPAAAEMLVDALEQVVGLFLLGFLLVRRQRRAGDRVHGHQ